MTRMYSAAILVVMMPGEDTVPGDIISFTKIDAEPFFVYIYPSVSNPVPIIVTVNTGNKYGYDCQAGHWQYLESWCAHVYPAHGENN